MKKITTLVFASIIGGFISIATYKLFLEPESPSVAFEQMPSASIIRTALPSDRNNNADYPSFITASEKSVGAVVHIKSLSVKTPTSMFDYVFGNSRSSRPIVGMGSGVIISPDGYIVTNNHVIDNSSELEVTLNNNRTYKAKVIGSDSDSDIALIKVDSGDEKLSFLTFGDSDNIEVGQWVLAVGNPFNLTSTVTAGIISAKARDLNPRDGKKQSFVQTDAAVNPGNSGGALVDINGNLVGINTAISSSTGAYMGYSFAVPSNVAKKVAQDIIEYGSVQKVILGVKGNDLNSNIAEKLNVKEIQGFYVDDVETDSGAQKAGIKEGDIIKKIDQIDIHKFADLSGYLDTKRPKDLVKLKIIRGGKEKEVRVELSKNKYVHIDQLGINVRNMSKKELKKYKINNGVMISTADRLSRAVGKVIKEINNVQINNTDDLKSALNRAQKSFNRVYIILVDKQGRKETLMLQ